jgi:hypothetical protein
MAKLEYNVDVSLIVSRKEPRSLAESSYLYYAGVPVKSFVEYNIMFPYVCNCCMKETSQTKQLDFVDTVHGGSVRKTFLLKIPFCSECKNHEFEARLVSILVFFGTIFGLVYSASISITDSPYFSILILIILLFVVVFYPRLKKNREKRLKAKGHAAFKRTVALEYLQLKEDIDEYKTKYKIRFRFKNKKYAELFAKVNNAKVS